jgi:hypothetical protein
MISDPKRLIDGFRGLPDGMDGSRLPPLVPPTSVWYAENVTFRDGIGAKTRPAFQEIPPSFWRPETVGGTSTLESHDTVSGGVVTQYFDLDTFIIDGIATTSATRYSTYVQNGTYFQGAYFYQDPRSGNPSQLIVVVDGVIVALCFAQRTVSVLNKVTSSAGGYTINRVNATRPVYMCQAGRFLIIQDGVSTPQIYDGYVLSAATSFGDGVNVVPVGKQMAYGQGRLFVASPDGTYVTAGDLAYSGSSSCAQINTITPPNYPVTCTVVQPTAYSVTATFSGATITLTGTGLPSAWASAGSSITVYSNNSADANNPIIGTFTTIAGGTSGTVVKFTAASTPTAVPTGKLVVFPSTSAATVTLTGVNLPVLTGNSFVISSDNTADASNYVIGNILATGTATPTTIVFSAPYGTQRPAGNLTLYFGTPGYVTVTTATAHGFSVGNAVTIQGTVSTSALNGTFVVQSAPTTTSFTISVDLLAYGTGTGGTVTLANAGADTDILNFTETNFLAEGGSLSIPADLGKIISMKFVPLQDSATGQGDLVVLCDRGASSISVAVERRLWSQTPGFQRVLYGNIGCVSDSTALVNGDMFFRSLDGNGIRSYRSARAEFNGYGQVPLSAEIDPILNQDTPWLLNLTSLAYHNDRLLMTCWPKQSFSQNSSDSPTGTGGYYGTWNTTIPSITYSGLAVLDFRSVANGHLSGTAKPAFEGVWTGQDILKVIAGLDSGMKRAFLITLNRSNPSPATQGIGIWEVVENQDADSGAQGQIPITSSITTKAYNFNDVMSLKKLLRLDLWFDSISNGSTNATVYYRPDDWPYWVPWVTDSNGNAVPITKTFLTTSSTMPLFNLYPGYAPQLRLPAPSYPVTSSDLNANTMSAKPMPLGYDFNFKVTWTGHARLGRFLAHALQVVEPVGGGAL